MIINCIGVILKLKTQYTIHHASVTHGKYQQESQHIQPRAAPKFIRNSLQQ